MLWVIVDLRARIGGMADDWGMFMSRHVMNMGWAETTERLGCPGLACSRVMWADMVGKIGICSGGSEMHVWMSLSGLSGCVTCLLASLLAHCVVAGI